MPIFPREMHLLAVKRERSLQSVRLFAEGLREVVTSIFPLMKPGVFCTFAPPENHPDRKHMLQEGEYKKDYKEKSQFSRNSVAFFPTSKISFVGRDIFHYFLAKSVGSVILFTFSTR
jgi:hypothetical protein